MTKLRPPLSPEQALDRVTAIIGYPKACEIVGKAERTLRNWSDPEQKPGAGEAITFDVAFCLDAAYQAEGGEGAPFLQCLAAQLELAAAVSSVDRVDIATAAAALAKETGEAVRAAILAGANGALPADLAEAEREIAESLHAHHVALAAVRARRQCSEASRAPEVAPSVANGR